MTEDEARARMAAQAAREDRLAAADVVLDNSGTPEELRHAVDAAVGGAARAVRPEPQRHTVAPADGGPVLATADPDWPRQAAG